MLVCRRNERANDAKDARRSVFRAQELRDPVCPGLVAVRVGTVLKRDGSASSTSEMRLEGLTHWERSGLTGLVTGMMQTQPPYWRNGVTRDA